MGRAEPGKDPFSPSSRAMEIARRLVGEERETSRHVLHQLLGGPKEDDELLEALEGHLEDREELAGELRLLAREQLVEERIETRRDPPVAQHRLTALGIDVALALPVLKPLAERMAQVERLQHGQRSVADDPERTWYVLPDEEEGWRVERGSASRASGTYGTKAQAVERAKTIARDHPEGQVVVHRADGSFQRRVKPG